MTQTSNNVLTNAMLDAFDIVSQGNSQNLSFNKTVIGTIITCTSAERGEYKIKFQDAYYYATTTNEDDNYKKGDNVYILIPNNNPIGAKKIIGLVENLGKGKIVSSNIETQFEIAGGDTITHDLPFSYASGNGDIEDILYDVTKQENKINIDVNAFANFARSATKLQIAAKIKTNIPVTHKRGNFGLKFDIEFFTDSRGTETAIRTYTLDTNSMIGTIYNLSDYLNQKAFLDFNGAMFNRIVKVTAFVNGFEVMEELQPPSIFIDNIAIYGMVSSDSNEWNTYYLTFTNSTPTFSTEVEEISLVANTVFKNRTVPDSEIEYYWFIRNSAISANDTKYCEHGGRGWYCLNTYNNNDKKWTPAGKTFTIKKEDMLGDSAQYKCVAVAKNVAVAFKEITVYNSDAQYYIDMTTTLDNQAFYIDQGTANITCNVKESREGSPLDSSLFNYYWSRLNSQGNIVDFNAANGGVPTADPTIVSGSEKKKTTKEIVDILTALKDHMKSCFDSKDIEKNKEKNDKFVVDNYTGVITGLTASILKILNLKPTETTNEQVYNKIVSLLNSTTLTYVKDNIFHNLRGSIITEKNTFVCTVFKKDTSAPNGEKYVGTGSIEIKNISSPQSADYYLILKNHNQIFKYNQQGKSPTHRTNTSPQTIWPISFEFYDKNHTKIDLSKSVSAVVRWHVPKENTLIQCILDTGVDKDDIPLDETGKYYLINKPELVFTIADTYDNFKNDNTIYLEVSYHGFYFKQPTNLSFLKEGANGTNGSDYYCRIVPHTLTAEYPTIYCWHNGNDLNVRSNFVGTLDKNIDNSNMVINTTESISENTETNEDESLVENSTAWFTCELWNSGVLLEPASVNWKILNNANSLLIDSPFKLASTESSSELYLNIDKTKLNNIIPIKDDKGNLIEPEDPAPFLTIEVSVFYEGKQYFATQPIALVYYQASPKYRLKIANGSGFNEAIYASDGTNPQYASTSPFTLEMVDWGDATSTENKINNVKMLNWSIYGKENLILKEDEDESKDKRFCELPIRYDGFYVNNGILCKIGIDKETTEEIRMYFPIHMYLNRYGFSHLNDWDGNSIKISEEEGYILTPQVGAGRKESDNTFTGMLMGEVKGGELEKNKVGLMGYGHGVQTMFLDAETGSAYFGKSNEISIVPNGADTQVKLGVWNLDNEAIWRGSKILGQAKNVNSTIGNIYLGDKGFSLNNSLKFDNESLLIDGDINLYNGKLTITNNPQIIKGEDETENDDGSAEEAAPDNSDGGEGAPEIDEEADTEISNEVSLPFEEGTTVNIPLLKQNYKAKINFTTYHTENIENKKEEIDTILSSNVIALSHNEFNNNNESIYKYITAYMRYIPGVDSYRDTYSIERDGKSYNYTKGVNHIYFNRGICVPSIRIGEPAVRIITYDYKTESEDETQYKKDTHSFSTFFGPSRKDCDILGTYNGRFQDLKHRPRRTYLRGDRLILQAFGQSSKTSTSSNYKGYFKVYAGRTFIYTYSKSNKKNPYTSYSWTTKSDERAKNIKPLDEKYYEFFKKIKPCSYTWKDNPEGASHIGYSAQQIKKALFDSGLNLNDFAALQIDNDNEEGKKYGIKDFHILSYEEFGPIYAAVLQRALNKIDELEERIKELEK